MAVFFISDLHLGHDNCLAFDNRPFLTIEEQDNYIIEHWNKVVGKDDSVWILGDFSWYKSTKTIEIFSQLNGHKFLCIGNHDVKLLKDKNVRALFEEIVDYKELKLENQFIVLSHYPIPCFNKHYYGAYHFYGHVHSSFEYNMMEKVKQEMVSLYDKPCNMVNVGAMMPYMNYIPRTFEELKEINKKVKN